MVVGSSGVFPVSAMETTLRGVRLSSFTAIGHLLFRCGIVTFANHSKAIETTRRYRRYNRTREYGQKMKWLFKNNFFLYFLTVIIIASVLVQIFFRYISVNYSLERYIYFFIFIYIISWSIKLHIRERVLLLISILLYIAASLLSVLSLNLLGEIFFRFSFIFMLLGIINAFISLSIKRKK